ncbi:hypothetical protein ACFLUQ_00260 [Chloroflexota bacterium]
MTKVLIEALTARKEFSGERYVLTKIDYSEEDAKADEAYYEKRSWKTKIEKSGIYWLLYTKIGHG